MSLTDQEIAEQEGIEKLTSEVQRRLLTESLVKLVELAESCEDEVVQNVLEDALRRIRKDQDAALRDHP